MSQQPFNSDSGFSTTGNISGNYVLGNAAFMNGIPASYGNSNVTTLLAGFGSNTVSTTGNVTAANFIGNVIATTVSATGNITGGNVDLTGNLTVNGNPIYGVSASYAKYTRTTAQTGAVSNTVIVCNVLENTSGSDISVNTSTGQVTLTAGRTYRLRASIVGWSGTTNRPSFGWYNETGSAWIGESSENYNADDSAANGAMGGTSEAVFTASATTVVSFRVVNASGTLSLGGNADFNLTGSYPWIDIEVIGGQAPITGFSSISTTGNVTGANFVGSGSGLTGVAKQATGSWSVTAGTNTYSFTVPASATYSMWVAGNIPNGIIVWNATATITNTNVPVVGAQYAWVYDGGGTPIDFVSIPNQFVGTSNAIVRSNVAPSTTTNRFDFSINNTSGSTQTVLYGYITL